MTTELIFTIAKIAGITLGGILAFVILLILLVLFVPIRYRLHVSEEDGILAYGKATWLLHIVSIKYHYAGKEEGLVRTIRLFGVPIRRKDKKDPLDEGNSKVMRWDEEASLTEEEPGKEDAQKADMHKADMHKADTAESPSNAGSSDAVQESKESASSDFESDKKTRREKKERKGLGIKERILNIVDKLKGIRNLLKDETFCRALSLCKEQLYRAWRAFRPRRIKGYVHFGFEDPSLTGRILGGVCMFYAFYGDSLRVIPDFDEQVIEGRLDVKGRIRVITVILIALKLFFDKDIRRLWAMISKEE